MKTTMIRWIILGLASLSFGLAHAEVAEPNVEFTYEDVKQELLPADEMSEMLIEMGAIDLSDALSSDLSMMRRNPRRVIGDSCRPGERCRVDRDRRDRRGDRVDRRRPPRRGDRWDRDDRRRRPPVRPPRRPPVRRRPPHHRYPSNDYVCYAENYRGEVFRAIGVRPRRVQQRAMNKCYNNSYRCYELGCY